MKRGEVYYISRGEPQTDSEIFSGRPAVIVSDDHLNSTSTVIEVVYLTTQTKKTNANPCRYYKQYAGKHGIV